LNNIGIPKQIALEIFNLLIIILNLTLLGNSKGCWAGRVLKCYAQCFSVMEIGKRGVKLDWLMGVIGFIGGVSGKSVGVMGFDYNLPGIGCSLTRDVFSKSYAVFHRCQRLDI
jgi:hypothetical protein